MEQELFDVLDFILNRADERSLQAVEEALKRRNAQMKGPGGLGMGVGKMAQNMAQDLQQQLSIPMDGIRQNIRDFVVKMIKQQVPDIPPAQLDILLNEWVPDPNQQRASKSGKGLPPDVLYTMVKQFVLFSLQKMSAQEERNIRKEMPNWPELYWAKFPQAVQKLISAFLKGSIDEGAFWQAFEQLNRG
ncbi:MAG: hypothetical protein JXR70_17255 [Spirochaetales bacterium]|nr:hypothetical protein [Spirochaetales bacterium]